MNEYYKDELLKLVDAWDVEQIQNYIDKLEDRITHTREQITLLKQLKKRKLRKPALENGPRGGM